MSRFSFIEDEVLRKNLDLTFDLVVNLATVTKSVGYTEPVRSSFRKVTIITTASIIEALLMYILKKKITESKVLKVSQDTEIIKSLMKLDDGTRIVHLKDIEKKEKWDKLNLGNLIDIAGDNGICDSDPGLATDIRQVKDLRNKQHISTLEVVDGGYTTENVEFVFKTAGRVKKLAEECSK